MIGGAHFAEQASPLGFVIIAVGIESYRALRVAPGYAEGIGEISHGIGQIVSGSSSPLAAPV